MPYRLVPCQADRNVVMRSPCAGAALDRIGDRVSVSLLVAALPVLCNCAICTLMIVCLDPGAPRLLCLGRMVSLEKALQRRQHMRELYVCASLFNALAEAVKGCSERRMLSTVTTRWNLPGSATRCGMGKPRETIVRAHDHRLCPKTQATQVSCSPSTRFKRASILSSPPQSPSISHTTESTFPSDRRWHSPGRFARLGSCAVECRESGSDFP